MARFESVVLECRTLPERLRYLAGKLRDDPGLAVAVAASLDLTADELERGDDSCVTE